MENRMEWELLLEIGWRSLGGGHVVDIWGGGQGTGQGSVPVNMALGLQSGTDEQGCEQLGGGCTVWTDSGFNLEWF